MGLRLKAAAKGIGVKDIISGKIFKKNPFKTDKGVKRTLGAIARAATSFGTKFSYDPQIQEARIESIKAYLGEDVFDQLFDTKQATKHYKRKDDVTYTEVTLKKNLSPAAQSWIDEQIKIELEGKKGSKVKTVVDKDGKAHLVDVQSDLRKLYDKTTSPKAYKELIRQAIHKGMSEADESSFTRTWEEELKHNPAKYGSLTGEEKEQAKKEFEKGKAAWEEAQIQKELSRRASQALEGFKYGGSNVETEVDKIFKAVSEAFDQGLLDADIYTVIHHTGYRPTWDEISELGALLEET